PDGIGIAINFDSESFDVRALMVNATGKTSDAVPLFPIIVPGPPFVPESPSILPGDSEFFVTMSLDLPQIHSALSKPPPPSSDRGNIQTAANVEFESPFAAIEKLLKIKIADDVLPLLGSEVSVSFPIPPEVSGAPSPASSAPAKPEDGSSNEKKKPAEAGPVIAISLRDKEGVKLLVPKLLDALGMKGVAALAQTERREDTELVSFGDFGYAFVGNFFVISADVASTRKVVDSYLKHETLSSNGQYKNYTRWQPRQLQG